MRGKTLSKFDNSESVSILSSLCLNCNWKQNYLGAFVKQCFHLFGRGGPWYGGEGGRWLGPLQLLFFIIIVITIIIIIIIIIFIIIIIIRLCLAPCILQGLDYSIPNIRPTLMGFSHISQLGPLAAMISNLSFSVELLHF